MSSCKIVQDLLPLYVEDICSPSSREYVEAHIAECDKCRSIHKAVSKRIQIIETQQNAKKSFAAFKRKMLLRRVLLSVVCVVLSLALLTALFYQPIKKFMTDPLPLRVEPIASTVSRLSDGSIYIKISYTEDDFPLSNYMAYLHPEKENTLLIEPYYTRWDYLRNRQSDNPFISSVLLVTTDESYPKYGRSEPTSLLLSCPYTCVMLRGSDGERIIWQSGDELPAADVSGEIDLSFYEYVGLLTPLDAASD